MGTYFLDLEKVKAEDYKLKGAFKKAAQLAYKNHLRIYLAVCTPKCILDPKDYKGITFSYCDYSKSRKQFTLDCFGQVRFCNHSPVSLGNIFKSSISLMMDEAYMKAWREKTLKYCKDCGDFELCKGVCRAASEQMHLSNEGVDPLLLYYKKKITSLV